MRHNETPQHARRRILIITRGIRRRDEGADTRSRRAIALQIVAEYVRRGAGWKYAEVAA